MAQLEIVNQAKAERKRNPRRTSNRLWAVLAAALLPLATGCAGFFVYPGSTTTTSTSTGNYVYIANATTDTLSGYAIGTSTLTAVSNSPYSLPVSPTAVAVTPANTYVYVASGSLIYGYSIGTGGVLTALSSGSALGIADVAAMTISPDGQWLFALDVNGVTLDEWQIASATGLLTLQTGASFNISGATVVSRDVKVSPNAAYVFVALGTGGTLEFSFNTSTGALTSNQQLSPVSSTTSDNALAISPLSGTLYIARSGTSGGLAAYTIASGGTLTSISGSPFSTGTQPYSIAVNNAGTYVYVANRGDSTISGYSIASTGVLTALSGSPYSSGTAVAALGMDSTGTYLLAAATGGSPDLSMYTFDAATTGKLDLATSTTTGTDPTGAVALALTH